MRRPTAMLAALAVGVAMGSASGDPHAPAASGEVEDLAVAAIDTWPMRDGCPARTRATWTRAPLGATEIAWTFEAPGPIEDEPRVWHDWVVVASHGTKGEGYVDVLRLSDGKPVVARKTLPNGGRLEPILWQDYVIAGGEAMRIVPELFMLGSGRKYFSRGAIVVAGDLYSAPDGAVVRHRIGQEKALWTVSTEGTVCSDLSARDGAIYVLTAKSKDGYEGLEGFVEVFAISDGRPLAAPTSIGWYQADPTKSRGRITVGREELFAHHPAGIRLKDDVARSSRVDRSRVGQMLASTPIVHASAAVAWGDRTFLSYFDRDHGRVFVESPARSAAGIHWAWSLLGSNDRHSEFVDLDTPAVVANGTVIASAGAFDAATRRIVERSAPGRTGVAVPARETLLVVEATNRLVARRAPRSGPAGGPALVPAATPSKLVVPDATVVTVDGAIRTASVTVHAGDRVVGASKAPLPLKDVGLLLDGSGRIVHGPDAAFVTRALPRTAARAARSEWTTLGKTAMQTHDPALLRRAIVDLVARGGRPDDVSAIGKQLTLLEQPNAMTPKPDAARAAEVEKRRNELMAAESKAAWTAFASVPESAPMGYRVDVLRGALATDPTQPDAVAWLRAHLPEGVTPRGAFSADEWLDLVEAGAQVPLRSIARKDVPPLSGDERVLAAARTSWRHDVVGLRSERLLLVTPVARPGSIARCLSLGELVCTALDSIFGMAPGSAEPVDPLVIHLFESKEEYVAKSPTSGPGEKSFVEWTSGHYSPDEGVSRLFVPNDADAFDRVRSVFAHELTHHWLDRRLPTRPGQSRSANGARTPAYFLEEGFASMIEEFVFDLRARTWKAIDPTADRLDSAVHAPQRLPWKTVVEVDQAAFGELDRTPSLEVPMRWTLGTSRKMSAANLFYAQSATICHYLFSAEDGKRRAALLAWVQDFHAGTTKRGDVSERVGLDADSLGRAALAWAKEATGASEK